MLTVVVEPASEAVAAAAALAPLASGEAQIDADAGKVCVPVKGQTSVLAHAVRLLDGAGLAIADIGLRRPTLDDVFLALTGHAAELAAATADDKVPVLAGRDSGRSR